MEKKKTVMVFGSFDALHEGHKDLFKQARAYGDELVVVVARDETIRAVKNHEPLHPVEERVLAIERSGLSDRVLIGNPGNKHAIIDQIKPDVICLGYDQTSFTYGLEEHLKKHGLPASIVRLKPYKPEVYKSSRLRKDIH